jgi:hypothetical protein
MTTFIPSDPPPTIPPAKQIAERMVHSFNAQLAERIHSHREGFRAFWDSPVPPDDILVEWGQRAGYMLAAAGENAEHIARLAAIIGGTIDDFILPEFYAPRRAFIPAQDGTVTLAAPAEGYDAWGRLIPEPEPEPQPEPEPPVE